MKRNLRMPTSLEEMKKAVMNLVDHCSIKTMTQEVPGVVDPVVYSTTMVGVASRHSANV